MQNYVRSVKSHLWSSRVFHRLSPSEKSVYLYLLTCPMSSDMSVYLLPLDQAALDVGMSVEEITKIIKHFEELELVVYNWNEEEICVIDYFTYGTTPTSGLVYEMYAKDFDKIHDRELIEYAVNSAKNVDISLAFFAALQDIFPDLTPDDFRIRKTDCKLEDIRYSAKRGRRKVQENKFAKKEVVSETATSTKEETKTDSANDISDDELPF